MTNKNQEQVITELSIQQAHTATILERITETIEGTARTPGMKEKITLAQYNIEMNKQAYLEMQAIVRSMEEKVASSIERVEKKIDEKFLELKRDSNAQNTFLEKLKPWVGFLSWFITGAGAILLSMILTGKLHIGLTP